MSNHNQNLNKRQVYRKEKRRREIRRNRIIFGLLVIALLAALISGITLLVKHFTADPDSSVSAPASGPASSAVQSASVPAVLPESSSETVSEPQSQPDAGTPTPLPTPIPVEPSEAPTPVPTAAPVQGQPTALELPWDTTGEMGFPYLIAVNRVTQTVTIYEKDANDNYTVPLDSMICSTGTHTPVGHFHTTDQYTWRLLEGNVYGQYATRITGHILFHSVPYYTKNKTDLEKEEFNKLGTDASLGCVRLQIEDCKWIYDECPSGTPVVIFDGNASLDPLGQPAFTPMDLSSPNAGWDPTDPDPANPWHNS